MESLRSLDYFDLSEVNYAIIERNGKITVIPKAESMPATREDLKIKTAENDVMYCIIENGKIIRGNFKDMGLVPEKCLPLIKEKLGNHNIGGSTRNKLPHILCVKDIAFCSMSEGGDVYIQTKDGVAQNFSVQIPKTALLAEKIAEDKIAAAKQKKARFA